MSGFSIPEKGSEWYDKVKESRYIVDAVTNLNTSHPDYVPTVVYHSRDSGDTWSEPLVNWYASMIEVSDFFSKLQVMEASILLLTPDDTDLNHRGRFYREGVWATSTQC